MSQSFSPLTPDQSELFLHLSRSLNEVQTAWLAGYLAALSSQEVPPIPTSAKRKFSYLGPTSALGNAVVSTTNTSAKATKQLTVLVGSRTGNGSSVAAELKKLAASVDFDVTIKNMLDYKPREMAQEQHLIVIVSTHGEGDPPFEAKEVYDFIHGKRAPKLDDLQFAVLGLGDSSYLHFCKTGKDFDAQLEKLGAKRIHQPAYLDVNFRDHAGSWIQSVLQTLGAAVLPQANQPISSVSAETQSYSAQQPYQAEIMERINLHGRGSDRATLHIELATEGLHYEPGDALGVIPENDPALVSHFLRTVALAPEAEVQLGNQPVTLAEALKTKLELSKLTVDVLQRYNTFHKQEKLTAVLGNPEVLKSFIHGRDVLDLFSDYPVKISAQQLVEVLRPLQPRLYSIASSPNAIPGEVHLTVGLVEYDNRGRRKKGACSNFLADVDADHQKLQVFIEKNPNFRLPENPATPIIMIGAGTGIAPFRAFVQERELQENSGKSWLFFGNRHFETEFLYQTEWQQALQSGALSRMNVAFSRDTNQKVYVQHRLLEQAQDLYQWIESGAHIYICGDRTKMAGDVMQALLTVIKQEGRLTVEDAQDYLNNLQRSRRLQTDVY
jgi:sulfite reductase (NADPH) flavoprotein alpha-component